MLPTILHCIFLLICTVPHIPPACVFFSLNLLHISESKGVFFLSFFFSFSFFLFPPSFSFGGGGGGRGEVEKKK